MYVPSGGREKEAVKLSGMVDRIPSCSLRAVKHNKHKNLKLPHQGQFKSIDDEDLFYFWKQEIRSI